MSGPILLFGMPRSGTTWVGKIFDSHPDTLYRHEPDTYPRLEALPRYPAPAEAEQYARFVQDFIAELPRMNTAAISAKLPLFPKSYYSSFHHHVLRAGAVAAKFGTRIYRDFPVIGARADRSRSSPVLVWKSIESLGRYGLILRALKQARGLHIVRHPCGQIASVLRGESQSAFQDKTPSSEYSGIFQTLLETHQAKRRGLALESVWQLRPEERLAWHWVLVNEKALEDIQGLERTRLVQYEKLCRNPLEMTQNLMQFTGLEWNKQTEDFVRQSTNSDKRSYYSVFKNPMHSAERWREELDRASIERILNIVQQSALAELYKTERVTTI